MPRDVVKVALPRADDQVLAHADTDPVALLVSTLHAQAQRAPRSLGVTILAPQATHRMTRRVTDLLEARGIECSLHRVRSESPTDLDPLIERILKKLRVGNLESTLTLDVSATSAAQVVWTLDALRRLGVSAPRVVDYCSSRNVHRQVSPLGPGQEASKFAVDTGAHGVRPLDPVELVRLFEIAGESRDPYALPGRASGWERELTDAARAMVRAAGDEEGHLRRLRATLQDHLAESEEGEPIRLPGRLFKGPLASMPGMLARAGLATIEGDERRFVVRLVGDASRGAPFFLAGGWLEVAMASALRLAMPDRPVLSNLELVWGRKRRIYSTMTEIDVAFVRDNRLHLISCKNEFMVRRVFRELHKLRALMAELGESWVRATLVSTAPVKGALRERLEAYEISVIQSKQLVHVLESALFRGDPGALVEVLDQAGRKHPRRGMAAAVATKPSKRGRASAERKGAGHKNSS